MRKRKKELTLKNLRNAEKHTAYAETIKHVEQYNLGALESDATAHHYCTTALRKLSTLRLLIRNVVHSTIQLNENTQTIE